MKTDFDRNNRVAPLDRNSAPLSSMNSSARCIAPLIAFLWLIVCCVNAPAQRSRQTVTHAASTGSSGRVLLIPLDDRPPCLQFPMLEGLIADTVVIAPPRGMLGRFTEPGDPERIAQWVHAQNLSAFDAVIVSVDMLAYGGLVNSRVHRTPLDRAMTRLDLIREIRRRAPRVPIYAFNVIMRLAPTADGLNESYREKLSKWAELSPEMNSDPALTEQVTQLEREIPVVALSDYKKARERNLSVNRASIEMVRSGMFEFLILAQDDAKPRGVHVADREQLVAEANRLKLDDRIAVQPGADEVAMLLLSRALTKKYVYAPRIAVIYSSEEKRLSVAPYEDRPLHASVSFQIAAAGAKEIKNPADADLLFYVFASRAENGAAEAFAERIARDVDSGRRVIVADIDFRGDVQGAATKFTEELRRMKLFPRLFGYASWNTAGNTIGTALPHGILYALSIDRIASTSPAHAARIGRAQIKFLLHRLIDDYAYHSLVRVEANHVYAKAHKLNHNLLSPADEARIEGFIRERMRPQVENLWGDFANRSIVIERRRRRGVTVVPVSLSNFRLDLPWGRTFEAEIDFDVGTRTKNQGAPSNTRRRSQ
ncbi:MAG: DUF4127 family protein [Acidobacteriota bacterium]|nr:DUF4127 family protein [Acidobacteriota bacterium]